MTLQNWTYIMSHILTYIIPQALPLLMSISNMAKEDLCEHVTQLACSTQQSSFIHELQKYLIFENQPQPMGRTNSYQTIWRAYK